MGRAQNQWPAEQWALVLALPRGVQMKEIENRSVLQQGGWLLGRKRFRKRAAGVTPDRALEAPSTPTLKREVCPVDILVVP